jgi:hypothetical protein
VTQGSDFDPAPVRDWLAFRDNISKQREGGLFTVVASTVDACTAFHRGPGRRPLRQPSGDRVRQPHRPRGQLGVVLRLLHAIEEEYRITVDIVDAFQAVSLAKLGAVLWRTITGESVR